MRLALFSPLPPARSGIAAYTAELLPLLARAHAVEVFVDAPPGRTREPAGGAPVHPDEAWSVRSAHDFVWRQAVDPFDLVVYQLGNDRCHDYMWPYLLQYPGMTVLHDAQLHQARGQSLLGRQAYDEYRAEFAYSHPDADSRVAEMVIARLGRGAFYLYPLLRPVLEAARLVVVHNAWLADNLRERWGARVTTIRMGVSDEQAEGLAARPAVRRRLGIADSTTVFTAFGRITPEKRIGSVLRALPHVLAHAPDVRVLLVGEPVAYYDAMKEARDLNVADHVTTAGYVDNADLPGWLAASDVCLCLRWPTARETSASWLRAAAMGRATLVSDLVHLGHLPLRDPRSGSTLVAGPSGDVEPVAMAVEGADETHCLRLGMRQLAEDGRLRERMGAAARRYFQREATLDLMAADYEAALAEAAATADPPIPAGWPRHLRPDPGRLARGITAAFGVTADVLGSDEREGSSEVPARSRRVDSADRGR